LRALVDQRAQSGLDRGRYYLLIGAGRQALAGNLSNWPMAVPRSPGAAVFNDDSLSIPASARADDDDTDVRTVVAQLPDGGFLLVGQALSEEESLAEHTGWLLAWAVGLITLLALLGGIWMGRSVLQRIDGVSNTAGEIMAGRLSRRMPVGRRGDEFDELSERLNAMLGRIDELVRGMREVTDNVAHDLRSPLNRLRNRLEITLLESRPQAEYQEVIAQTITDLDEVLNTFNTLLSIAQAEAGVKRQHFDIVDLTALCTDLAELYEAPAEDAQLELSSTLEAGLVMQGNRDLLAQALGNLLDNAIKYTPSGGHIRLSLIRQSAEGVLTVEDNGPGIPAMDRERVLERFVRLDSARSSTGNGLGLALVRAAAHVHGGHLTLEDTAPGLKVTLRLPLAADG
ncbi:MAG: HAMP domain-containing sensor histidine kinase, partial [Gammaproteobacteria bacterium]